MKIYISGKITGIALSNAREKFKWHSGYLDLKGFTPVNPFEVIPYHKKLTWKDYMAADIKALMYCEAIYMLNCWGQSKGARIEYAIAKELGLKVIYQGELEE